LIADVIEGFAGEEGAHFLTTGDWTPHRAQVVTETNALQVKTWLKRPKAAIGKLLSIDGYGGTQARRIAKSNLSSRIGYASYPGGVE